MSTIAIIPARGGSKRIPQKNIKPFLGHPIISYSIKTAIESNLFDEVMVSTDSDRIAKISKNYGAEVPFLRSSKNSNDYATTYEVIEEVLLNYKKTGKNYDFACCIYPCTPLLKEERLKEAYHQLINENFDIVFPVLEYSFPIQRSIKIIENQKAQMLYPEHIITRSQDLEPTFHDAGQFYWLNVKEILKKKAILTDNTGALVLSEMEAQDIDNVIDWQLAELKYQLRHNV